ncbi:MAG TPA: protein kinase [Phycisphaerae bacterium]
MAYAFKHGDRPLDGYVIQRGVGRGGFGEVYYAISDGGKEVALKYLRDNPSVELRGVSHCLNLKSPHLVTVYDVKQNAEGEYFIVMEYVSGPSLRDLLIAESRGMGPQKAAYFVREIARGLAYLHDRGIVHRDLKPGNIFYEDGYVKIGDYGLSKFISVSRHSAQTASVGTVHYMAPEVGSGSYQRGIDIYALGVILYEMLLGRVPYEGATMGEVLMKHLTAQPEVDELLPPFPDVIRKALAKDPNLRYQTVDEMVEAILDVDDIKQSVVGFDPVSLAAAVRRGVDVHPSPMPSPNLTPTHPRYSPPPAPLRGGSFGERFARKHERISRKLEKKLAKLQGKARFARGAGAGAGAPSRGDAQFPTRGERMQRFVLSAIMSIGIAVGIGLLVGSQSRSEEAGASAGMLVIAMSAGVGVWRRLLRWMTVHQQVRWAKKMLLTGCCAVPMLVASAPLLSERNPESGVAVLVALLIAALLIDWESRISDGAAGELRLGQAFKAGLLGLVLALPATGIFGVRHEGTVMLLCAAVAAASSLVVQVFACVRPSMRRAPGTPAPQPTAPARSPVAEHRIEYSESRATPPQPEESSSGGVYPPLAIPIEHPSALARAASATPVPAVRWGITRVFWSVVSFLLVSGALALALAAGSSEFAVDERVGTGIGALACAGALVFSLSKLTLRRRPGVWRETLRPLLLAVSAFGIAAPLVPLNTYRTPAWVGPAVPDVHGRSGQTYTVENLDESWGRHRNSLRWYRDGWQYSLLEPHERWALRAASGISALLFATLLLTVIADRRAARPRRLKPRPEAKPFVIPDSAAPPAPVDSTAPRFEASPAELNA